MTHHAHTRQHLRPYAPNDGVLMVYLKLHAVSATAEGKSERQGPRLRPHRWACGSGAFYDVTPARGGPMENEFSYPIIARPGTMLALFAGFLALLHVLLVVLWPLRLRTWKKVDYVWLGVAALGIIGAAAETRRLIAATYASIAESRAAGDYALVRSKLEHIASPVVCRGMGADIQAEFDRMCQFGRASLARLPADPPDDSALAYLTERPNVTNGMLKDIYEGRAGRRAKQIRQGARTTHTTHR